MRPDERALLLAIADGEEPRAAAARQGMPDSRARYLLERKWAQAGWYDFGVVHDLGWLTDAGRELAERERAR